MEVQPGDEDAPKALWKQSVLEKGSPLRRYRIFPVDFDTSALLLEPVTPSWDTGIREQHEANQCSVIARLVAKFGEANLETKIQNARDLGVKPFSVVAFHNRFLEEARCAFISGCYYPALTAACCLGERILNQLLLQLRDEFASHPDTNKKVLKETCDNWGVAYSTLHRWQVLTSPAKKKFEELHRQRSDAVHFRLETDTKAREQALLALKTLQEIVEAQFSAVKVLPWTFQFHGETYIKKECEEEPFVRSIYLPNCGYVTPQHRVTSIFPWTFEDQVAARNDPMTDDQFKELRTLYLSQPV